MGPLVTLWACASCSISTTLSLIAMAPSRDGQRSSWHLSAAIEAMSTPRSSRRKSARRSQIGGSSRKRCAEIPEPRRPGWWATTRWSTWRAHERPGCARRGSAIRRSGAGHGLRTSSGRPQRRRFETSGTSGRVREAGCSKGRLHAEPPLSQRRVWDSNPRDIAAHWFSRPGPSAARTTLPDARVYRGGAGHRTPARRAGRHPDPGDDRAAKGACAAVAPSCRGVRQISSPPRRPPPHGRPLSRPAARASRPAHADARSPLRTRGPIR